MTSQPRCLLITLPHSHYCEKARWALDLAAVDYDERPHLPLIHRWYTRSRGGGTVPLLVAGNEILRDSSDIVRYADRYTRASRLLPSRLADRQEALEMERYFDRELGPAARRWAYFQLLGSIDLLNRLASRGVPRWEQVVRRPLMAMTRPFIRRGYRVDYAGAVRSLQRVQQVFEAVGSRLADGQTFLVADEFGVADISFAALSAPVLLPAKYGGATPSVDEVPEEMRTEVRRLRATRAGQFAARLYLEHRGHTSLDRHGGAASWGQVHRR